MAPTVRNISLPVSSAYEGLFCPEDGDSEITGRDLDMYPQARIIEEIARAQNKNLYVYIYIYIYIYIL
jgi:hypothetical protein